MKKTMIALLISGFMGSAVAEIPVIDPTAIAQATALVAEAKNQLKELQDQVNTAKNQLADFQKEAEATKKRLEGYSDFSSYFDSSSAYLKNTLDDAAKSISSQDLDNYYKSNNINDVKQGSGLEAVYKSKIEKIKTYERLQDNLSKQTNKMDRLQRDFENATTPQQKQDILNTVQMEKLKMDVTMQSVNFELQKQKEQEQIIDNEVQREYMRNENKSPEINGEVSLK